ncbi:type II toxin-antitoxin system HicB family antitoxin [Cyanobacterium aponinum]|uniref:Type II toxin-antitoxin system HicB family antitoxin n=1 Tax=Cyanobacterium aponinum 0216 TaxID=2676140 RepID=A0A844GSJ3_9CHRO|nr:type II toxin-antitoxin system HicB family antitoxin [Cyanobacterium aponinum]MTF38950.1 type II toxin-antitoxin system HicB family antitoxin [Cyanobacterium aponinum 0216]
MKTQDKLTALEDYLNLNYPITFHPENEGGYTVMIQDLERCISEGETVEEAMKNILSAKQPWLETAWKHGDFIPLPSHFILDN